MSWLSRAIDAGGDNRYGPDDIEDSLFLTAGNRWAKTSQFWMLLVLASIIAASGVVSDSTPAVIGAMIVAPLATPTYGVALATVTGSRRNLLSSMLLPVEGIAVNVFLGFLVGLVSISRMPVDVNPQITAARRRRCSTWRSPSPSVWPARSRSCAATSPTAAGYSKLAVERGRHPGRRAKVLIAVFVVVLVIPLSFASLRTLRYEQWIGSTETAARGWARGTGWEIEGVTQVGGDVVIKAIGPGSPPPLEALRRDVRSSVPRAIQVSVIEDSGRTIGL